MDLPIPDPALLLLIGPAGSGKSAFARKRFVPTEVVSSDHCRALVSDDENEQAATGSAFEILHLIVRKRMEWRRLTVIDATNIERAARRPLLERARRHGLPAAAIVFDLPEELLVRRNEERPDRDIGGRVVRLHRERLERTLRSLPSEGFHTIHVLGSAEESEASRIVRRPFERTGGEAPEAPVDGKSGDPGPAHPDGSGLAT